MQRIEDRGIRRTSDTLEGKKIALAVTGGIGSVESVKIIREIRRRGGLVTAFMTPEALLFITALSLEWASERPVVTALQARVEHLETYDMVVVAPTTLNTLSKASLGITDNPVLLLIASQIGRKGKLLFVPTMNGMLYEHPSFKESETKLKSWGAKFYVSALEEDRLKMPDPLLLTNEIEKEFKG